MVAGQQATAMAAVQRPGNPEVRYGATDRGAGAAVRGVGERSDIMIGTAGTLSTADVAIEDGPRARSILTRAGLRAVQGAIRAAKMWMRTSAMRAIRGVAGDIVFLKTSC